MYIDTTGKLTITISNSCSNCASGLNGAVYCELDIIKTVPPFDTIASSDCLCLWGPDNNNQKTYLLNSRVADIPSLTDIRVSFAYCGCDTIPFSTILGVNANKLENNYTIYPNPFSSSLTLQTDNHLKNGTLIVYNLYGQTVKQINHLSGHVVIIHRNNLPSGMYFFRLAEGNKLIISGKIIITD